MVAACLFSNAYHLHDHGNRGGRERGQDDRKRDRVEPLSRVDLGRHVGFLPLLERWRVGALVDAPRARTLEDLLIGL